MFNIKLAYNPNRRNYAIRNTDRNNILVACHDTLEGVRMLAERNNPGMVLVLGGFKEEITSQGARIRIRTGAMLDKAELNDGDGLEDVKIIKKWGYTVTLDKASVYPDDPGRGTPALVERAGHSGTYWAVIGTGEFSDGTPIGQDRLDWLESLQDEIEEFLYA